MNVLALILMTSCPVAADPMPAGAPCACSQNAGSWTVSPTISRPRLFGRMRGWLHRSPREDGFTAGVPVSVPAPARVVQAVPAPVDTPFPTTAEPPLASGIPEPRLASADR
jgi:hypothetical protein